MMAQLERWGQSREKNKFSFMIKFRLLIEQRKNAGQRNDVLL